MTDFSKYTKSPNLKGTDLPQGQPTIVTIKRAYEHTFPSTQETRPCIDFYELDQRLVCNRTQITTLMGLFGPNGEAWEGKRVELMAVTSNYQGKLTIAIKEAPPAQAEQTPTVRYEGKAEEQAPTVHYEDQATPQAEEQAPTVRYEVQSEPPEDIPF